MKNHLSFSYTLPALVMIVTQQVSTPFHGGWLFIHRCKDAFLLSHVKHLSFTRAQPEIQRRPNLRCPYFDFNIFKIYEDGQVSRIKGLILPSINSRELPVDMQTLGSLLFPCRAVQLQDFVESSVERVRSNDVALGKADNKVFRARFA